MQSCTFYTRDIVYIFTSIYVHVLITTSYTASAVSKLLCTSSSISNVSVYNFLLYIINAEHSWADASIAIFVLYSAWLLIKVAVYL